MIVTTGRCDSDRVSSRPPVVRRCRRRGEGVVMQTFGGVAGKRSNYQAVDLPGVNLNFSGNARRRRRQKGACSITSGSRSETSRRSASGSKRAGEVRYAAHEGPNGVASAVLTDPWGTSIELTEGLNRLRLSGRTRRSALRQLSRRHSGLPCCEVKMVKQISRRGGWPQACGC